MDRYFYKSDCFNLFNTFYNGQCFRWEQVSDGVFEGIAGDRPLRLYQVKGGVEFDCAKDDFAFWSDYFDLHTDYSLIEDHYKKDDVLKSCVEAGNGMHILRQDLWEVLISFIISQNNNISRIKKIISNLSAKYGREIKAYGQSYYSFPTAKELSVASEEELKSIGLGYRAEYIVECVKFINNNADFLSDVINMDYDTAREKLLSIKGVGPKVANCILLFGLRRFESFPVDTWINKAMLQLYPGCGNNRKEIEAYAQDRFGINAGLAQQYMFFAARQGVINFE